MELRTRVVAVLAALSLASVVACVLGPKQDDPAGDQTTVPTIGDAAPDGGTIGMTDDAAADAPKTNGPEAGSLDSGVGDHDAADEADAADVDGSDAIDANGDDAAADDAPEPSDADSTEGG